MIGRIGPVEGTAAVAQVSATVRRTDRIDADETGGIAVQAADPSLLDTLKGTLAARPFIDAAVGRYPAVVLGSVAARTPRHHGPRRPGDGLDRRPLVERGRHPRPAAAGRRRSTGPRSSGSRPPRTCWARTGRRRTIYVRADPDASRRRPGRAGRDGQPGEPRVGQRHRPSDAIEARAAAATAFTALLVGLGAVALLVGGLGIANVMLMSVLERRSEIGLRRALGATRGHIVGQFLAEAVLLAGIGGLLGRSSAVRRDRLRPEPGLAGRDPGRRGRRRHRGVCPRRGRRRPVPGLTRRANAADRGAPLVTRGADG